jgi:hypothetical protein
LGGARKMPLFGQGHKISEKARFQIGHALDVIE